MKFLKSKNDFRLISTIRSPLEIRIFYFVYHRMENQSLNHISYEPIWTFEHYVENKIAENAQKIEKEQGEINS